MPQRSVMVICMALIAIGLGVASAQQETNTVYLPVVIQPPGGLETLVLQRSDLPSNYTRSARFVDNEEEAQTYPNPVAATAAFATQGRETSYYVTFTSQAFAASGALSVSDKVARYKSVAGAQAGQAFALQISLDQEFEQLPAPTLGEGALALRRTFTVAGDSALRVQYIFSIQRDVYVAWVYVVGYEAALDTEESLAFAEKAVARLPPLR